jgi:STE24 endopeptidase
MEIIQVIILTTFLIEFTLQAVADLLNIKRISKNIPDEFNGIYDSDKYKKSQEYLVTGTKFGLVQSVFGLIVILLFWFGGGFQYVDSFVRGFEYGPLASGLIYIGILLLFRSVLSLPFSLYSTFVIEEKFGFNRTTPSLYLVDLLKGLLISLVIGAPLLSGILLFFNYAGNMAWFYCWVATTIFIIVVQYIFPTFIMPLFNRFDPIEEGELKDSIFKYARSIDFTFDNIYIMDGSKRSSKSNAFFTGFGKSRRIVLFDTLVNQHTVSELVAVLAHEMGHYKKKHIQKGLLIGIIQMGVLFFIMSFFISYRGLFDAFYMEEISIYAGLVFFGMLYSPLGFILEIVMHAFSRKNEYEADRFAVETSRMGEALVDALKKLSVNNLSNLLPHPVYVFLNYSHPPVLERINYIRRLDQETSFLPSLITEK